MWTIVRFEVPPAGHKKYVAVLVNATGQTKKRHFGDRRYQQFHDKLGFYHHLDHGDDQRRRSYRSRHAGEEKKKFSPGWFAWKYLW